MIKKLKLILLIGFLSVFLHGCITYRAIQVVQATAVVDRFYQALNQNNVTAAVDLYSADFRQTVGEELLKENLNRDMKRFGSFVDYQVKSWKIENDKDKHRQLVLVCQVAYQKGATLEVFVIQLGGSERISSHEIKKERLSEGEFQI